MSRKGLAAAFLIIFLLLLFFLPILPGYFSQDDFFHLRAVMTKNLYDIPSFFLSMQSEYAFYRPLSRETFNLIMYKTFGLNPLPFHLVNFALILTNIFLTFSLIKKIVRNQLVPYLAVLIYAVSSIHSIELYYLASVQTLLASFFMLLGLNFYLLFFFKGKHPFYFLALITFILGLVSHETALVLPGLIFFAAILLREKKGSVSYRNLFFQMAPFLVVGIIYLAGTSLFSSMPGQKVYQPVLNPKSMVNSLSWYTLWSFGLSEIFADFIGPKFNINPSLMRWYGQYTTVSLSLFVLILATLMFLVFKIQRKFFGYKPALMFAVSFVVSLSPFLLFPQHKSSYYLSFSTACFSALLACIIAPGWKFSKVTRGAVILFIMLFAALSYQTVKLNSLTYWAAKRAAAAQYLLTDIKKVYPNPEKGAVFYIKDDPQYPFIAKEWGTSSKQAFYILSGADAFKLIYRDPGVKVFFEGMGGLPADQSNGSVISYTAKFPY